MKKKYGFFIPDSECLADLHGLMHFLREQVVTHHRCWFCGRVGRSYEATVQHMVDKSHCKLAIEGSYPDLAPFYAFGAEQGATDGDWVRLKDPDTSEAVEGADLCKPVSTPYCAAADAAAAKTERLRKLAPPPAVSNPQTGEVWEEDGSWERVEQSDSSSADEAADELPMPQVIGPTELVLPDGRVLGHRSMQRYYRQAPRRVMAQGTDGQSEEKVAVQEIKSPEQPEGLRDEIGFMMQRQAAHMPDDVGDASDQLQDSTNQPGGRVVAAGPPPIDKEARSEQTKGDSRRDRQRFKASEARGKIAGGRAVMWQVGL
jgi:pre-60S factor REI1